MKTDKVTNTLEVESNMYLLKKNLIHDKGSITNHAVGGRII